MATYELFPSISEREKADAATTEDVESEDYRCGVNDCKRKVDNPDEKCWQHRD